jgi:hypothetical protein
MTPFQEKFPNATKDTLFRVKKDNTFTAGSIVRLYTDDGTISPKFELVDGYTKWSVCDGQPGAYEILDNIEEILNPEVKKPMELLYDIQSVLSAAKYLEPFHAHMEREEIAQRILADIRAGAKKDSWMTGTMGYVILFDRGNEYVSAEVYVTPSWGDSFFMEEEL